MSYYIRRNVEMCGDCMHLGVAERFERLSAMDQSHNEKHLVCRLAFQGLTFAGKTIDWAREQPWYEASRKEFESMPVPRSCGRQEYETIEKLREL